MTIPHIVSFADLPATRWANGRGQTIELAREPRSGEFTWRLSIATIAEAATFSPLPGVSRVLMALTDGPLELTVDGAPVRLGRYDTVAFTGDQEVAAVEPASAQRDLNLMVRGGTPTLRLASVSGRTVPDDDVVALVVLEGDVTSLGRRLHSGDCIVTGGVATSIRGNGVVALAAVRRSATSS